MPKKEKSVITPTVAILTNFQEFNPGYSLTGIVVDQAHMLAREGHKVIIYVNERYDPEHEKESGLRDVCKKYPDLIKIKPLTKFMHLTDYESYKDITEKDVKEGEEAGNIYANDFLAEEVHSVFTHDFIFTGWNLPYSIAIKRADEIMEKAGEEIIWHHWVHSVPSGNRDWWNINSYRGQHFIVFPNKTEIMRVAESFGTYQDRVEVIPHIKDIRNWYDFSEDAMDFTEEYPRIMSANVVQVYPCSTDRLSAKQLDVVIKIFGFMKTRGCMDVFLVAANQWATGRQRKEDVKEYIEKAKEAGLEYGVDFVFTSEYKEKFATGIPKRFLRELQLLQNVFVFPTKEESFGLVGPEAAFSGALPVINKSLTMQFEVMSTHCPAFDFGSFHQHHPPIEDPEYINAVANAVLNRLYSSEPIMAKLYCKKRYNMDHIYTRYYLPLFC
jgi:glycosyltransferase involved in cell wall biosynthesis